MPQTNAKQSFKIRGDKYELPRNWKEKILSIRTIVGKLESYPAHASGRQRANNQIRLNKGGRIQVIAEEKSELKNMVPKPSFLLFLEEHIHNELIRLNCPPEGPDFKRLQVFREVFEWIIEAFRSYKPVLKLFKEEYEKLFLYYDAEIKRLNPIKRHLYTVCAEYETKYKDHVRRENEGKLIVKKKRDNLEERLQIMKDEKAILDDKVQVLKKDLSIKHEDYITQVDAKKLLNLDSSSLRSQMEDLLLIQKSCHIDTKERPDNLLISMQKVKEALKEVKKTLQFLEDKYDKFVPRKQYVIAKQQFFKMSEESQTLDKEIMDYENEIELLTNTMKELNYERDFFYLKMCESQQNAKKENRMDFNRIIEVMMRLTSIPGISKEQILVEIQTEMRRKTLDVVNFTEDAVESRGISSLLNSTNSYQQMAEFLEVMLRVKPQFIFKPSN